MKHLLALLLLLAMDNFVRPAVAQSEITLAPPEGELTEKTVLLLSFPTPMVDEVLLEKEVAISPIIFDPPLEGSFTWTSESTGEFSVSVGYASTERSLKTLRRVRLRPDLRDLQDRPVKTEQFGAVFSHSKFDVIRLLRLSSANNADGEKEYADTVWELDEDNADPNTAEPDESQDRVPAHPYYRIEFAREIAGLDLQARTSFRDAETGEKFPVQVIYESFQPITPNRSSWVITSKSPLPPGRKWLLAIEHLTDAQKNEARQPLMRVIPLGTTETFVITEATAYNQPGNGGFVHVEFSVNFDLRTAVPENFAITPPVGAMKIVPTYSTVRIYAAFEQGKSYEFTVKANVCSVGGQPLPSTWKSTVTFARKRPAVVMSDAVRFMPRADVLHYDFHQVNTKELRWNLAPIPLGVLEEVQDVAHGENSDLLIGHEDFGLEAVAQGSFPSTEAEVDVEKERRVSWSLPQGQKAGTFLLEITGQDLAGRSVGNRCIISVGDWTILHKESDKHHFRALDVVTGQIVPDLTLITPWTAPEPEEGDNDKTTPAPPAPPPPPKWTVVRTDAAAGTMIDNFRDSFVALTPQTGLADPVAADALTEYMLWRSKQGWEAMAFPTDSFGESDTYPVCSIVKDRAVYRPGETFYFKGYLRIVSSGSLPKIPPPTDYVWKILDDSGDVAAGNVRSDELGTWNGSWSIPSGAWGGYTLELTEADAEEDHSHSGRGFRTSITVGEDRPPAFSVVVNPMEQAGDKAQIRVQSTFFHGAPNANAKVRWRAVWMNQWWLDSEEAFMAADGSVHDYLFSDPDSPDGEGKGLSRDPGVAYQSSGWEIHPDTPRFSYETPDPDFTTPLGIISGESKLDEQGHVIIPSSLSVKSDRVRGRCRVVWSVEVISTDGQAHDGSATSRVQLPPYVLGVATTESHQGVHIVVASLDFADQHVSGKRVRAKLYRVDYKPLKEPLASGLVRYKNSPSFTKVWEKELVTPADLDVPVSAAGHYVCSVDAPGNPLIPQVSDCSEVSMGQNAETPVYGPYNLGVKPDKRSYRAGEMGRFTINAPYVGTASISVETDRVLHSQTIHLRSNLDTFNLEMKPEWFPNAWVTVHLLKPMQGQVPPAERFGFTPFRVGRPELELQVDPELDIPGGSIAPGSMVTGHVRVTADGHPVKDAEVLLYAVDEATLQLGRWQLPDFHEHWFLRNLHRVNTYTSLNDAWMPSAYENLSGSQKGFILGDGATGGKNTYMRKKGLPIATWQPTLRTDAQGRAPFSFQATEDLTTFRIVAVASTGNSAVGSGRTMLRQHKPLQVEPLLPRFVREGDLLHCRVALRQDFAPEVQNVRVAITSDPGVELLDPLQATTMLSGTASSTVQSFRARVKPGTTSLEVGFSAGADFGVESYGDGATTTLPVRPAALDRQRFVAGALDSLQVGSHLNQNLQEVSKGRCDLLVSSSPWLPTLDKLLRYEQMPHLTLEHAARLLRVITAADLARFLPPTPGSENADPDRIVKESIDAFRLADWKVPGFAAAPNGKETDKFATLLSAMAVLSAAEADHEVPKTLLDGLCSWIQDAARMNFYSEGEAAAASVDASTAFACAVLGLYANSDRVTSEISKTRLAETCVELYRNRQDIGIEGRAFLILAFLNLGTNADEISNLLQELPGYQVQPSGRVEADAEDHSTPMRTAGICLLARAAAIGATWSPDQRLEEVAKIEASLTSAGTLAPQEAIWWLAALSTIVESIPAAELASGTVQPAPDAVSENGATLAWFNRPVDAVRRDFAATNLGATSGSWLLRVHGSEAGAANAGDSGLVMSSSRINLTKASRTGSKDAPFRIGDRILITYEFKSGQNRRFVQLDDQLPACIEPLGTDLANLPDSLRIPDIIKRRAMKISSVERRDDRLVLVFDSISDKADRYCVLARVNAAGEFHWPAPLIRSLYDGSLRTEGLDTMAYAVE